MKNSTPAFIIAALFTIPLSVHAQEEKKQEQPIAVADVEELMDQEAGFVGKRVIVSGEIEDFVDNRSFVLESGGLFDDEITVILPKDAKGADTTFLREDSDVVVTGTVHSMTVVEVEREFDWDFEPEIEVELEDVRTYLIAEKVDRF